ncbi:MAG: enoyl-ACP reductase [Thermodesulfobacteriota bacterium]
MASLEGARALVVGVANERSIAWGIAQALAREGARLGFTFLGETLERRVRPLAESLAADLIAPCDVTDDAQIDALFAEVDRVWGGLDVLIHAVAFANREDLSGRFVDTGRQGFHLALDVSAYSLVALARAALPRMTGGGSILTLTFAGSQRVFPNYNVMGVAKAALEASVRYLAAELGDAGIRVNAISAGPIKTLSAAGIKGFRDMLHYAGERAPLKRNVTPDDVAGVALALVAPGGAGVTGQVIYVDAGLSILGV